MDLKQSVARLAPRQHEPLALRYIDGLDRETVAELMGITVEGVKKLLGTAVRTLRTSPDLTGSASSTATLIVSTDSPHQFSERPYNLHPGRGSTLLAAVRCSRGQTGDGRCRP
ncbi:sigma-70 family RNA polymerase sigma factor [Streptomyces sp. NPDC058783]|uniref:sigma-70 family RNA polymerase sigma factor n=1 Tax=Streptomyces sp. NPDC058783 TaxID=3346633 RepID=UPI00369059F3